MEFNYDSLVIDYTFTEKELIEADNTIRRLTGRDPDDANGSTKFRPSSLGRTYSGRKRSLQPYTGYDRKLPLSSGERHEENDKIDEYISSEEEELPSKKPSLQSTIVAKDHHTRSRKATIEQLNSNVKIKARNRRMFGALIGTLQKFQKEEKKREKKESMRAEIEQRVEEANTKAKEMLKKEKESLFITRREKQVKLRVLKMKIERAESHEVYERNYKMTSNFIITKAKPPIFYLPSSHVSASKKCLEETKIKMNELIDKKRAVLQSDFNEIEELYKRDSVSSSGGKEANCTKDEIEIEFQDVSEKESESLVIEQEESNFEEDESTIDKPLEDFPIDQEFEPIYD